MSVSCFSPKKDIVPLPIGQETINQTIVCCQKSAEEMLQKAITTRHSVYTYMRTSQCNNLCVIQAGVLVK